MELFELIKYPESDWLDFKAKWHDDNARLLLDILCMANCDANSDRYLVIGYNEDKTFGDINIGRKKSDDFFNLLNTSNFNRIPDIQLETISIDGNELDIIIIKKTTHRPYFLTIDKPCANGKSIVRAGVIYTRTGSSNTPIISCASESLISDMWRERFGLSLSPKERMEEYIKDTANWKSIYDDTENNKTLYYYEPFPEFTMEFQSPADMTDYSQPAHHASYLFAHSIGNSYQTTLKFKYHSTILKTEELFICDKGNYLILHPKVDYVYYHPNDHQDIHIFANNSQISNRGKTIEEIDGITGSGEHLQIRFCYNLRNSFTYNVQQILNTRNFYDLYTKYYYFDESQLEGNENEHIRCPHKIYLFNTNDDIEACLKEHFFELQQTIITKDFPNH